MEMVTNQNRNYTEVLNATLQPLLDFDCCEYAVNNVTQQEYIRIADTIGSVAYFDVTGMTRAEILKDVCKVVLLDQARLVPASLITDREKKRAAAKQFRSEAR